MIIDRLDLAGAGVRERRGGRARVHQLPAERRQLQALLERVLEEDEGTAARPAPTGRGPGG
jgi:hypothetical protein